MPDRNRNTTESLLSSSQINQKRSAKVKPFEGQVSVLEAFYTTAIYNLSFAAVLPAPWYVHNSGQDSLSVLSCQKILAIYFN